MTEEITKPPVCRALDFSDAAMAAYDARQRAILARNNAAHNTYNNIYNSVDAGVTAINLALANVNISDSTR